MRLTTRDGKTILEARAAQPQPGCWGSSERLNLSRGVGGGGGGGGGGGSEGGGSSGSSAGGMCQFPPHTEGVWRSQFPSHRGGYAVEDVSVPPHRGGMESLS